MGDQRILLQQLATIVTKLLGGARIIHRMGGRIEDTSFVFYLGPFKQPVNGWVFKFFNKGEKEVITKSVVTVLPNHVIYCFRLPKAVTKKLKSAMAQFCWSSEGSIKCMD